MTAIMSAIRTVLDFNRASLSDEPINTFVNELIEQAEPKSEDYRAVSRRQRDRLGMSAQGPIRLDVRCAVPARIKDIFARGHFFEESHARSPDRRRLRVRADGRARIHRRRWIVPRPCRWNHRRRAASAGAALPLSMGTKCLNTKGWKAIERDGLVGLYAVYAAQVAIYQAYLDVTIPALFTVVNADTCERLHFLVPFDAAWRRR